MRAVSLASLDLAQELLLTTCSWITLGHIAERRAERNAHKGVLYIASLELVTGKDSFRSVTAASK